MAGTEVERRFGDVLWHFVACVHEIIFKQIKKNKNGLSLQYVHKHRRFVCFWNELKDVCVFGYIPSRIFFSLSLHHIVRVVCSQG